MQNDKSREVLTRLINASGRRATEVARDAGVPQSTLSRILNGKIESPSDRQISRLARYFGVTSDQIRGREPLDIIRDEKRRYTPDSNAEMLEVEIVEGDEPLRPDEVWLPIYREVEFSAGNGATRVVENHGAQERFSLPRLSRSGVQPENAALAVAKGDSMTPAIQDGATIGIDKGCRTIRDGEVYALDHDGMLRIKYLYRLPLNRVRVVSENSDEYPEEVYSLSDPDAPKILGRVFWAENFF
ncbi:MAG: LexA family transcriptional regulator [Pseudomonadota bacterium]